MTKSKITKQEGKKPKLIDKERFMDEVMNMAEKKPSERIYEIFTKRILSAIPLGMSITREVSTYHLVKSIIKYLDEQYEKTK